MPRSSRTSKDETFNFRIDPGLKAAFAAATEAEDKPAGQVLRDFMRAYVRRKEQQAFEAEAGRQSRLVAAAALDPNSDDAALMRDLDDLFDAFTAPGDTA